MQTKMYTQCIHAQWHILPEANLTYLHVFPSLIKGTNVTKHLSIMSLNTVPSALCYIQLWLITKCGMWLGHHPLPAIGSPASPCQWRCSASSRTACSLTARSLDRTFFNSSQRAHSCGSASSRLRCSVTGTNVRRNLSQQQHILTHTFTKSPSLQTHYQPPTFHK